MKKRIFAICVSAIIVLSLVACGQSGGSDSGPMDAADIVVAGMVFQEDQFMKTMIAGYEDAARDMGVKECMIGNSASDIAKEKELIETYQAAGVNGLAIAVYDPDVAIPALEAADDAGMKIAATNIDLNAPFMVGGFTSDSKALAAQCGEAAAKFISENLGGSATIGIIHFLEQVPEQAQQRIDGFKSALEGLDVEYVADFSAPLPDVSFQRSSDMITANPDINVILACNDGGTKGAVAAIQAAGRAGEIFVFGFDVDEEVIDMLKSDENILQAAIGQDPYTMGYEAMALLIRALTGEDYSATQGKTTIVPGKLADRANPGSLS